MEYFIEVIFAAVLLGISGEGNGIIVLYCVLLLSMIAMFYLGWVL